MKNFWLLPVLMILSACTSLSSTSFSDEEGAIRGYDPVAYFTQSTPVKGSKEFTFDYQDARWHFASAENLALFAANPQRYAPQYGGYCAYAMSKGFIVSIDPEAWAVRDDKLYLNFSKGVRTTWLKDPETYIKKADINWSNKDSLE